MPGWTDLKDGMDACWKVLWNVDPLPLIVPESFELLLEFVLEPFFVVLLELQALRMTIARTAVVSAAQRTPLLLMVVTVFSSP
jgi:hypothetical protein